MEHVRSVWLIWYLILILGSRFNSNAHGQFAAAVTKLNSMSCFSGWRSSYISDRRSQDVTCAPSVVDQGWSLHYRPGQSSLSYSHHSSSCSWLWGLSVGTENIFICLLLLALCWQCIRCFLVYLWYSHIIEHYGMWWPSGTVPDLWPRGRGFEYRP